MSSNFEFLLAEGYNDGYYWDMRIIFKYNDKVFIFCDIGSGSGYVENFSAIAYADGQDIEEVLNATGERKEEFLQDFDEVVGTGETIEWVKEGLILDAEKLIASGKDEVIFWANNDEKWSGKDPDSFPDE